MLSFNPFTWAYFVPTHENAEAALEFLEKFITLGVLPATLTLFFKERKKERLASQYLVYDSLDEHYGEFLKLMMEDPLLPVYPPTSELSLVGISEKEQIRRLAAFELLIFIFERAFLMYNSEDMPRENKQWGGWAKCMYSWCTRKGWITFFERINGDQFDTDFVKYMNKLVVFVSVRGEPLPGLPSLEGALAPAPVHWITRQYNKVANIVMNYGMALIPLALGLLAAIYITAPEKEAERKAAEKAATSTITSEPKSEHLPQATSGDKP